MRDYQAMRQKRIVNHDMMNLKTDMILSARETVLSHRLTVAARRFSFSRRACPLRPPFATNCHPSPLRVNVSHIKSESTHVSSPYRDSKRLSRERYGTERFIRSVCENETIPQFWEARRMIVCKSSSITGKVGVQGQR